jgi:hypothetical protein
MKTGINKTHSVYEKKINRLLKTIRRYQLIGDKRKELLLKHNIFLNELRDQGRLTKDEINVFFKK